MAGPRPTTRCLFLVGAQRSGTTMLLEELSAQPDLEAHGEGSPELMHDYRLISVERLQEVRAATVARLLVAKPLCDSQWVDRLLQLVDGSRAIWVFRAWPDVVNSMLRMWPGHFAEVAARFLAADDAWLKWRSERIEPATRRRLLDLLDAAGDDDAAAAAVFWWQRNRLFFDLVLHQRPDFVRPLRYRDFVTDVERWLQRLLRFAGSDATVQPTRRVHAQSLGRDPEPGVPAPIREANDRLFDDLRECAAAAWRVEA